MSDFDRQQRYLVYKISDLMNCGLTEEEEKALFDISMKVNAHRLERDAHSLMCVVVEDDWPEYEPTWAMIEERMSNE